MYHSRAGSNFQNSTTHPDLIASIVMLEFVSWGKVCKTIAINGVEDELLASGGKKRDKKENGI